MFYLFNKSYTFKKLIQNKKKLSNIFAFSIFDIVISGIYLGLFLIIAYLVKMAMPARFNIAFELPFYIFLGITLNWFKGSFVALIFDITKTALTSNLFIWTPEYGLVPPAIAILAALFFKLVYQKDLWLLIPTVIFILAIIFIFFYYFSLNSQQISRVPVAWRSTFDKITILSLIGSISLFISIAAIILFILYYKTKEQKWKIAFLSLMILAILFIIFRWFWHPIAFIKYYNRYINRSGNDRLINNFFFYYLSPIILKSAFSLPIYTFCLVSTIPLINHLNYRHNYQSRLGY